ncbi:MAG: hypothetical protein OXQ96_04230 [Alphaproteobacteria bacterium]|nr:hypothetical protein [Alphaproteobacteria bacterium]
MAQNPINFPIQTLPEMVKEIFNEQHQKIEGHRPIIWRYILLFALLSNVMLMIKEIFLSNINFGINTEYIHPITIIVGVSLVITGSLWHRAYCHYYKDKVVLAYLKKRLKSVYKLDSEVATVFQNVLHQLQRLDFDEEGALQTVAHQLGKAINNYLKTISDVVESDDEELIETVSYLQECKQSIEELIKKAYQIDLRQSS